LYQDKKILYIILTNLIFNAIKYSQENTPIDILVTRDKNISITITDKGIGIPFEDQKHIFNRFYRATNTTHLQGTGIGLNIVKSNIEALGGSISFNSIEKMGTQFTINFPQDIRTFTNLKNKQ
jgi:signal transduction histidine kinase